MRRGPVLERPRPSQTCRAGCPIHLNGSLNVTASKRIIITGGAGFIGSGLVRHLIAETSHSVLVIDKLTYAGNLDNLSTVAGDPRLAFVRADVADRTKM